MLNSYKELIVWQKSIDLAKEIYILTGKFPKSETFGLISQMRRSAVSIPFISIAFGSGAELETQILLSESLEYGKKENLKRCSILLDEIMRMLNKLIANLNSH